MGKVIMHSAQMPLKRCAIWLKIGYFAGCSITRVNDHDVFRLVIDLTPFLIYKPEKNLIISKVL